MIWAVILVVIKREIKYVAGRYYWMKMMEDIDNFTASCDVCQRGAKKLNKNHSSLHTIKVKTQVWYRIGVDLIGPLNETPRGNRHIITCTDYFSKWPEAEPLVDKSAEGVAFCLYRLITRYRAYAVVVSMFDFHRSDRGSNPGRGGKIS